MKKKQPLTSIVQIFDICRWLRKNKPALVIMSGAPSKVDIRFLYRVLAPKQKFAIVMATPSVSQNKWLRIYQNKMLQLNLLFFNNLIVDKSWRQDRLKLPKRKLRYFELGFYDFGYKEKDFSALRLVYLGVFGGREIEKTIEGIRIFLQSQPDAKISYDLAGKHSPEEAKLINSIIRRYNLEEFVTFHGFLSQADASQLIQNSNVGISYIPNKGVYGYSSTKTLEYLIAGLPVISTHGVFKDKYINESNGVLHEDNAEAFADAIAVIYRQRFDYKPQAIRDSVIHLSHDDKIKNSFMPLIDSLIK